MNPTIKEIRRAAAEEGAEPVYTQRMWRSSVRHLLRLIDMMIQRQKRSRNV